MSDPESFGELLARHREATGLSQATVARRSGLSERALRALERGVTKRPRRHTVTALAEILGLTGADLVAFQAAAHGRAGLPAGSLVPVPFTSQDLIGRERQLAILTDLVLGARHRIVTVVGPAGVGKTRLVAELVATQPAAFTLELSAVSDPDLLVELIAEAVGAGGPSRLGPQERVAAHLRGRQALLILDCVERLVAAAPAVSELVRRCPGLTVLATSLRPWNVRGEREVRLEPLPIRAATELFVRRASAARPGFAAEGADADVVAEICRRLEGLPLAIELAAARMRVLGVRELAERLDRRLQILSGGPVDQPPRHRSLRGAIEASLELVGPETKTVFAWLGAFPAGARLGDLEAVAGAVGSLPDSCVAAVEELAETGLIRVAADAGVSRYTLPDAVRELAVEQLESTVDSEPVRRAMAAVHLDRLVSWRGDPAPGGAITGAEADNLRAAVGVAIGGEPALLTGRVLEALYRHYFLTGRYSEGEAALARAGANGPGLGFTFAGRLALVRGDTAGATHLGETALARLASDGRAGLASDGRAGLALDGRAGLASDGRAGLASDGRAALALDDHAGLAETRLLLGAVALERRDWPQARSHLRAALVQARKAGDLVMLGRALNNLGVCSAFDGRLRDAERQTAAALTAKRRSGAGPVELARTLNNLAENAREGGSLGSAVEHAEEAIQLFVAAGHNRGAATAAGTAALVWLAKGDIAGALAAIDRAAAVLGDVGEDRSTATVVDLRRVLVWHAAGRAADAAGLLGRSLPLAMRHGYRTQEETAFVLARLAEATAAGDPALAAAMLGAARRLLSLTKRGVPPVEQVAMDDAGRIAKAALGDAGFAREWTVGAEAEPEALAALCARLGESAG